MQILSTERLNLRVMTIDDANFYLTLINDPSFIENIHDKGIRTVEAAKEAIINGPLTSQAKNGFSLYVVERKDDAQPMGICGLVKRETLKNIDIGYAFLPQYVGQGYAREAARAVVDYAHSHLQLSTLAAITSPTNDNSNKLLQSLGFVLEAVVVLAGETKDTNLYAHEFAN
ncbi:GNAT family N-acetyltransferase [Undibacterium sp. Ji50W]|uniref:GNAT family N-acetyltransferase n=1 Tax=Undibacterium sp. Ji50W TaxID=3413041 RepID=UPI003BF1F6BF